MTASSEHADHPLLEMFTPDLSTKFQTDAKGPHWVLIEYHVEVNNTHQVFIIISLSAIIQLFFGGFLITYKILFGVY